MLERYGWNDTFQHHFDTLPDADGLIPGRVIIQQRGLYTLFTAQGDLTAQLGGRFAHDAAPGAFPVAGDWVAVAARAGETTATIHHVLPRAAVFVRKATVRTAAKGAEQVVAANIDIALLVSSLNGDLNLRRLERYLFVARDGGAAPVIVLTKADACDEVEAARASVEAIAGGAPIYVVSSKSGLGLDALNALIEPGKTAALLGSSGVGKSTLVNALAGEQLMATQAISGDDKRGRHTTTHREIIALPSGGLLLDSPGMRELGVWDADAGTEAETFPDVEALLGQCRFTDCHHTNEPGCAILAALATGALDPGRWASYGKLQGELAFEARKTDPKLRQETRKHWAKIHKDQRAKKKWRDGDPEDA